MPIVSREVIIKARILENEPQAAGTPVRANNGVMPQEEIIKICIERVLEILKEKQER